MAAEFSGLSKSCRGIRALIDVDMTVETGMVQTVVGENGAGNSKSMRTFTGAVQADAGEITFDGGNARTTNPDGAGRAGVDIVYQKPSQF